MNVLDLGEQRGDEHTETETRAVSEDVMEKVQHTDEDRGGWRWGGSDHCCLPRGGWEGHLRETRSERCPKTEREKWEEQPWT